MGHADLLSIACLTSIGTSPMAMGRKPCLAENQSVHISPVLVFSQKTVPPPSVGRESEPEPEARESPATASGVAVLLDGSIQVGGRMRQRRQTSCVTDDAGSGRSPPPARAAPAAAQHNPKKDRRSVALAEHSDCWGSPGMQGSLGSGTVEKTHEHAKPVAVYDNSLARVDYCDASPGESSILSLCKALSSRHLAALAPFSPILPAILPNGRPW